MTHAVQSLEQAYSAALEKACACARESNAHENVGEDTKADVARHLVKLYLAECDKIQLLIRKRTQDGCLTVPRFPR